LDVQGAAFVEELPALSFEFVQIFARQADTHIADERDITALLLSHQQQLLHVAAVW